MKERWNSWDCDIKANDLTMYLKLQYIDNSLHYRSQKISQVAQPLRWPLENCEVLAAAFCLFAEYWWGRKIEGLGHGYASLTITVRQQNLSPKTERPQGMTWLLSGRGGQPFRSAFSKQLIIVPIFSEYMLMFFPPKYNISELCKSQKGACM